MPTFRKRPIVVEAVQWFKHGDHPLVRKTSYLEINKLLGTSGCSPTHPYWDWQALGILQRTYGFSVVKLGDWVVTGADGTIAVVDVEEFAENFEHVESEPQ